MSIVCSSRPPGIFEGTSGCVNFTLFENLKSAFFYTFNKSVNRTTTTRESKRIL